MLTHVLLLQSISVAMSLMHPRLYFASAAENNFVPVGCCATSMQSDKVLYLDHGSAIIIWSGTDATGASFDHERACARRVSKLSAAGRCPRPLVLEVTESTSMARWLQVCI